MAAHAIVDAATGQDDFGVVADLLVLVGQVIRVDADAVSADEARPERQEAPFGRGGGKHVAGVDAEFAEDQGNSFTNAMSRSRWVVSITWRPQRL